MRPKEMKRALLCKQLYSGVLKRLIIRVLNLVKPVIQILILFSLKRLYHVAGGTCLGLVARTVDDAGIPLVRSFVLKKYIKG
ncbi:hypothetical protein HanXRQr2_Chr01g0035861 [Helianthus annuus]|uniref:Uncharacterized protein n=1 Tax=Helianthus annuus TaxID=4232 RepID=A0A9K3JXW0_HELAN|nr:hypothetical protein HanXRQr2_Chr01g0035861 [Helianthus annuus]KAJ0958030.1 hypothetical protein HanPSC8_Chr01g0034511 [Helianthus annuus]